MKNGLRMIANGIDVSGAPEIIKILPMGHVESQKGDFIVDKAGVESMKRTMKARGLDIVVDYEHQTLNDVQAPAGGWVKDIWIEADAVVAKVEWTDKAKEYLVNKEYRYLSPVVLTRKTDKRAVVLHSIALTNTPAIDNMYPIINKGGDEIDLNEYEGGNEMELLKQIAKLLGLGEGATEEKVLEEVGKIMKKDDGEEAKIVANKTILGLLGLEESAKTEDVTSSIMALKNPTGYVSVEAFNELKERLDKKDGEGLVVRAMKAGKITATQKEWAEEYALKDPTGFEKFIDKAPAVVPMGEVGFDDTKTSKDEVDLKALKFLGVSAEDYEKYGKEDK